MTPKKKMMRQYDHESDNYKSITTEGGRRGDREGNNEYKYNLNKGIINKKKKKKTMFNRIMM